MVISPRKWLPVSLGNFQASHKEVGVKVLTARVMLLVCISHSLELLTKDHVEKLSLWVHKLYNQILMDVTYTRGMADKGLEFSDSLRVQCQVECLTNFLVLKSEKST